MSKGWRVPRWWIFLGFLCVTGCGTVDSGERSLPRWSQVPDPEVFGTRIQPMLVGSCGAAACHGGSGSFRLLAAEPLPLGMQVDHPMDLEEPMRTDYYTVLAFSDLDVEEDSALLVWGSGEEPSHPGQKALSDDDRAEVIQWLEGNP